MKERLNQDSTEKCQNHALFERFDADACNVCVKEIRIKILQNPATKSDQSLKSENLW